MSIFVAWTALIAVLFVSQSFINTSLFPHLFLILVVFRSVSHGLHRLSASSSRKTFITWTQRTHVTCSLQDDQHVRTAQIRVKQEESVRRQRTVSVDNPLINNSASSSVQLISVDTRCLAADDGDDYDETSSISSRLPLCNFIRHQSSTISCRRQTENWPPGQLPAARKHASLTDVQYICCLPYNNRGSLLEHSDSDKKYSDSIRFGGFDWAHHCRIGV